MNNYRKKILLVIIIISLSNLIWIFALPVLPFIDLPFRLAESTIVKNFFNGAYLFNTFYDIPHYIKSNTLYTYFCAYLTNDVEFSNKIYYALYFLSFPLSSFYFIYKLKGNVFYSLLSFLFVLNHNVHWGFTGYMLSSVFIIITFVFFYDYFYNKKYYLNKFFWIWFIVIFFTHFQSALYIILIFLILSIINNRYSKTRILFDFFNIIPVIVLMSYIYTLDIRTNDISIFNYLFDYYSTSYFVSIFDRIKNIFIIDNFFLLNDIYGSIYALLISLIVLFTIIISMVNLKRNRDISIKKVKYIIYLLLITAVLYFFLPDNIPGQNIIYERYSIIIFILLISIGSFINMDLKMKIIVIAILISHQIIIQDYMFEFYKENNKFNSSIFPESPIYTLSGLIIDNNYRGRKIYAHFPMYYTVWQKGITTGIIDYRYGIIKRKANYKELPVYKEWDINFQPDEYYSSIDWLLVKAKSKPVFGIFGFEKSSGEYFLYKNIHTK